MFDQDPREKLLHDAAGICVGVPYSATIKNEEAELSGQVIFVIADTSAWLTFKFFYEPTHPTDELGRTDLDTKLHIDLLDVCWNVKCAGFPLAPEFPTTTVTGWVKDRWLSSDKDGLIGLTVGYSGIPTWWRGNADFTYYEGYNRERLGQFTMAGIQLSYQDWSVVLKSVPEHRVVNGVRHIAMIERTQSFSVCEAQQFVSDLHYFLCFLFSGNPGMVFAEGVKESKSSWGSLHGRVHQPPDRFDNWFGRLRYSSNQPDLSGIFAAFCGMGAGDKAIISNMITHYTASEEILASGKVAIHPAIVASYSALEGLVRWIGYSHTDIREEYFYRPKGGGKKKRERQEQERRLAKNVSLLDVLVCVLARENLIEEERQAEIKDTLKPLRDVRDSIAHVTRMHEWEGTQLYDTWNKSQCLVEALILRKLGHDGFIPNRTAVGVHTYLGIDLLKKRREEGELWLDAHIPPREEGGECCPHRTSPTRPSGPAITSISSGA